jgi:amino-transferase class IV
MWPAALHWQQTTSTMRTLPTPNHSHGLFETLLVVDGEPVALEAHLERLAASLAAVFAAELRPGLREKIATGASGLELGRMRIVASGHGAASIATETVDPRSVFPSREWGAELYLVHCPGGLGAHKWADRAPLGETRSGPVPLLLDRGDEVLEAGRANVFAVVDEALFTPAADGRILPGTARSAAIEVAAAAGIEVRQQRLRLADLLGAEEAFLTGSVRGVEPVRSFDGERFPPLGPIGERIADGLARRWETGRLAAARS